MSNQVAAKANPAQVRDYVRSVSSLSGEYYSHWLDDKSPNESVELPQKLKDNQRNSTSELKK